MKQLLALFAILLLFACNKEEQSRLSSDTINLGTEVLKTYISLSAWDTVSVHTETMLLDSALKTHKMTRDEFNRVIVYFKNNPDRFNDKLAEINEHIDQIKLE